MIDLAEARYLKKKLNQPLKTPAQPHTISKQNRIPKGNLLASPMFPLFKNWKCNEYGSRRNHNQQVLSTMMIQ